MADPVPPTTRPRPASAPAPGVTADDFRAEFGEELASVLNVETWAAGRDLAAEYRRIEQEVREAAGREGEFQRHLREQVLPRLAWEGVDVPHAGHYGPVPVNEIAELHRGLLFPGGVEGCDGTVQVHDTLPLTIYQVGVALVSYRGDQGTWCQRLFRRDLRQQHDDPVAEVLDALARRGRRAALNHESPRDHLSQLARRAVMSYAERAVLVRKATARWRVGHGAPAEYQLLAGAGNPDVMILSVRLVRELIEDHPRFVFVASEPADLVALSVGQALRPLEYAVVDTLANRMATYLDGLTYSPKVTVDDRWDGRRLAPAEWVGHFRDGVASQVVVGVYRATRLAPAQLFYAHRDYVHEAARVALCDSVLEEHRGFPLLITLADRVCAAVYGGGSLRELADAAYAAAGLPFRYGSERTSRDK